MSKASKQDEKPWREDDVADVILDYLTEHPQASDTFKGIAEWWIMRQRVRVEVNLLKKVLHQLTGSGVLEVSGEGDNRRYRLKADVHGPPS
jgi:hypothetical protein